MSASTVIAPVRVAILGAAGRMGQALIASIQSEPTLRLAALIQRTAAESPAIRTPGLDGLTHDLLQTDSVEAALPAFDVLVDFTRPAASLAALEACERAGKPIVIGTTGFSAEQKSRIVLAASHIPVCFSANYSIGVTVCLKLLADAARALGDGYDVEIVEAHHRHKVDAPSGTALAMGEVVAAALGRDLARDAVYGREGQTGARESRTIGFSAIRGGDVVGDHTVMFLGEGERVEITHKASTRTNFARGALRAAGWLAADRAPGLYTMSQVLGL
jgi:4-hydroxy-tetrahydrodipicolinate reductase